MTRIITIAIVLFTTTLLCVPASSHAYTQDSQVSISLDDLAKLPENERNAVLAAYKRLNSSNSSAVITPDTVNKSVEFLKGINLDGLSDAAGKVADAIIVFCTKLGVGVDKFLASKIGIIVFLIVTYKMGIFGSIIGSAVLIFSLLLFVYILFSANRMKRYTLVTTNRDADGKVLSSSATEELVPKFNAIYTKISSINGISDEDTIAKYYDDVSFYRTIVSVVSLVLIIIIIVNF